jgi:D-3-phosphoglycerate dehydrogenase
MPRLPAPAIEQVRTAFPNSFVLPASGRVADLGSHAAAAITAIATPGKGPIDVALLDQLPHLRLISCFSSGLDGIDLAAARSRGIHVTHVPDVLAEPVADIALALTIDVMRGMTAGDRYLRQGLWRSRGDMPLTSLTGGKLAGIVGFGRIGNAVARRLAACGMRIAYHGRRVKADVPHPYYDNVRDLAADADVLVLCCPSTPETRGLVTRDVLDALGSQGFLINVSRGAVVDEAALIAALQSGAIAGAGLDVYLNEPNIDPAFLALENVVLLPHIGGAAKETRQAMYDAMLDNIRRHFAGEPLVAEYVGS